MPGYGSIRDVLQTYLCPLARNPFLQYVPPGHFYSPIPDLESIEARKDGLFNRGRTHIPGIETRTHEQLELLQQFRSFYDEIPFRAEQNDGLRYYFDNLYFTFGDGIALYSMLRHFRPARVIEVGAGFSSAVMLDTNDQFLSGSIEFTFIEPFPERLLSLMSDADRRKNQVKVAPVQDVPVDLFTTLTAGDILFIDSSHVAKVGSDVVHLLTYVLPALNRGVVVHFHDIFWPFEYPHHWVQEGRAWNETYVLKAFLQYNAAFKILLFNSYLAVHHRDVLTRDFPLWSEPAPGASLWLERTAD
jgi:hypothetical protein